MALELTLHSIRFHSIPKTNFNYFDLMHLKWVNHFLFKYVRKCSVRLCSISISSCLIIILYFWTISIVYEIKTTFNISWSFPPLFPFHFISFHFYFRFLYSILSSSRHLLSPTKRPSFLFNFTKKTFPRRNNTSIYNKMKN